MLGLQSMNEEVTKHVATFLGKPLDNAITEIVGNIKILVVPNPEAGYVALVTSGMSDTRMNAPEGAEEYCYAEVFMFLPISWPLDGEAWKDPNNYWPIEWLRLVAHQPEQTGAFMAPIQTMGNNEPFAPNTKLSNLLFLDNQSEFGQLKLENKTVNFYQLFPLYEEEKELLETEGPGKLFDLFQQHNINQFIDPQRQNVAKS